MRRKRFRRLRCCFFCCAGRRGSSSSSRSSSSRRVGLRAGLRKCARQSALLEEPPYRAGKNECLARTLGGVEPVLVPSRYRVQSGAPPPTANVPSALQGPEGALEMPDSDAADSFERRQTSQGSNGGWIHFRSGGVRQSLNVRAHISDN